MEIGPRIERERAPRGNLPVVVAASLIAAVA